MPRPVISSSALRSTVLVAAAALLVPSLASAATTVSRSGNALTITGDDAPSRLVQVVGIDGFELRDELPGAVLTAGAGCVVNGTASVQCGLYGPGDTYGATTTITAKLGGGDDFYKYGLFDGVQTIDGEGGNDTIETAGGKDVVAGGLGNDDLNGGRGDDILDGGAGNDTVDGWDGNDVVAGGPGIDRLLGDGGTAYSGGNDTILARDGEGDSIDCGFGADRAEVDGLDVVANCSTVDRPVVGPTPAPNPTPTPTPPPSITKLTVTGSVTKKQTPAALSQGKKITASFTPNVACAGKVLIAVSKSEAKRLKLGTKALTLATSKLVTFPAGSATKVDVAVDKKYRSKLSKATRVKTAVGIVCAAGETNTFTGGVNATFKK